MNTKPSPDCSVTHCRIRTTERHWSNAQRSLTWQGACWTRTLRAQQWRRSCCVAATLFAVSGRLIGQFKSHATSLTAWFPTRKVSSISLLQSSANSEENDGNSYPHRDTTSSRLPSEDWCQNILLAISDENIDRDWTWTLILCSESQDDSCLVHY